jgi:membrane protein DedA with SNARE-associated domain
MNWQDVQGWVEQYGYIAVAVGALVDQSGLQSFVVAGGVVAGVSDRFSLPGVVLAGMAGNFFSDALMFGIGRWRADWLERIIKSDKGRMRLRVLRDEMHRRALILIVFGRFLPWVGRFVPAAAGLRKLGTIRVLIYSVLGSAVASLLYALIGYYAAESVKWLEEYALFLWIGALVVSFPVARWLLRRFDRIVKMRLREQGLAATFPEEDVEG